MVPHDDHLFKGWLIGLLLAVCIAGCARLPDYARPQFTSPEDGVAVGKSSFGYRQLTVADFWAVSLPESYAQFPHRIQARSCISLRPTDDTMIRIAKGSVSGKPLYVGTFATFAFQAYFNPECSWWSPDVPQKIINYVLQHEQIHFALAELTARRLNQEARDEIEQYMAMGNTQAEAQAELVEQAKRASREAMQVDIRLHTRFDEDTSLVYDSIAQQKWFDDVTNRLQTIQSQ